MDYNVVVMVMVIVVMEVVMSTAWEIAIGVAVLYSYMTASPVIKDPTVAVTPNEQVSKTQWPPRGKFSVELGNLQLDLRGIHYELS